MMTNGIMPTALHFRNDEDVSLTNREKKLGLGASFQQIRKSFHRITTRRIPIKKGVTAEITSPDIN